MQTLRGSLSYKRLALFSLSQNEVICSQAFSKKRKLHILLQEHHAHIICAAITYSTFYICIYCLLCLHFLLNHVDTSELSKQSSR